jgi:hypothetical protein
LTLPCPILDEVKGGIPRLFRRRTVSTVGVSRK